MARIRILSDLHLELSAWTPPSVQADVVVLAGDIDVGVRGLEWARRHFHDTPVVYVPGNHEFYGARFHEVLDVLHESARSLGIHLLDRDEVVLDGTRFLGTTLWAGFELYGSDAEDVARAMRDAKHLARDYRSIRFGPQGKFHPEHARELHRGQVKWLEDRLAEPGAGATVVVTHHLPHPRSIHPKYEGHRLNPGFASDLSRLLRPPVRLWVHGHTHESLDYNVGDIRVMCNPRGYIPMQPNVAFDPALVVDLAVAARDG
jgi:3',5'-cyclic AMP phosphodiesterase CpdA